MNTTRRQFIMKSSIGVATFSSSAFSISHSSLVAQDSHPESDVKSRPLFDGKSLDGWHAAPRLLVPKDARFNNLPSDQLRQAVIEYHQQRPELLARLNHTGVWQVVDGVIVGGQEPGSGLGAYLLSDQKFGDFELSLEARPDWPIDTGIMVRAHELGSIGFQILVDHRSNGAIGGVYGNNTGSFRAYPFVVDGDEVDGFRVDNLRPGIPDGPSFTPDFAATLDDFLKAWKPNDWNSFRMRCVGELPVIETWINGTPIAKLDTSKLADRVVGYDPKVILERLGRKGHVALEVHDNGPMGRNRWAPGAVSRWRNISIIEL